MRLLGMGMLVLALAGSSSYVGAQDLQVSAYTSQGCVLYDHPGVTGDDRGPIALSSTSLFYTGDLDTGLFPLDLSTGVGVGFVYDGLLSDLGSGVVYSLAEGTVPLQNFTSGTTTIDNLLEVDPATGALTGASIALSTPIEMQAYSSGFFSGIGRIVLWDTRDPSAIYDIALPSGTVTVLPGTPQTYPVYPRYCEVGAFWGVAGSVAGSLSLDFSADNYTSVNWQTITRLDVSTGEFNLVSEFSEMGDLCSLTVDPAADRWYFHFEGTTQFGSGSETTAYCTASVATSGSADLMASSVGPALDVALGGTVLIPIQVNNAGPDAATDVELIVTVPGTLEVVTVTPSQGSCFSQCGETVVCQLGSVNAGASATVTLEVEGVVEGSWPVGFYTFGDLIDPNIVDNQGERMVNVTTTLVRQFLTIEDREWDGVGLRVWTPDFSDYIAEVPIGLPGEVAFAGNGLDVDPTTGELFAIVSTDEEALTRFLVTVDPRSGMASAIGDLGDRFASLAFNDVGNLYGLTGFGASVPETLYEINPATAAPTLIGSLANGGPGEALAFSDADSLLYHLGGVDHFESVGLPGPVQTPIPLCATIPGSSVRAATHLEADHLIIATGNRARRVDTDGSHQWLGTASPGAKGLVLLEPQQADLMVGLNDSADPVTVGDTFAYSVSVFNAGPDDIGSLGFIDNLPGHVAGISATPSQGSCAIVCDQVYCDFGAMPSGTAVSINIDVQAVMTGQAYNEVRYSGFGDPNPGNNWVSEDTTILEPGSPGAGPPMFFTLYPWPGEIRRYDPFDFSLLDTAQITLDGSQIASGNGMAQHPRTGVFWALLTLDGQFGRELVRVDPMTGVAVSVGDTGDRFSGLAFDDEGVLYGITGNGATLPLQLFTLDQSNGVPTPLLDLSGELDWYRGISLAYHPDDGMLYASTGNRLVAVDPSGPSSTPVDLCRIFSRNGNAATSLDETSLLMVTDWGNLYRLDLTTGIGASLGGYIQMAKGIVWTDNFEIFADGFESGDTTAWSRAIP
jgi:uncharacterized repeat protein (TIGR01451 family)